MVDYVRNMVDQRELDIIGCYLKKIGA